MWKQETANGAMWFYGSNLRMRDLVLRQVSTQCAISNNVVYLNDLSATLNDTDFVNATGTMNLRRPYRYSGKFRQTSRTYPHFSRCFARPAIRMRWRAQRH